MADHRDDFIIALRYALLKKGAKQKFSLFFLISFSILIITLDKASLPLTTTVRAILNDFVYQTSYVASTPGKFLNYLNQKKIKHFNLINKNKILKEEIEILKNDRYDSLFLKTENTNLKQALKLGNARDMNEVSPITAKVILDQNSPYLKSLSINKGRKDGIIKGMTVFSKSYLIGTIIESNYLTSRVLLITDLNSKIPVVIQETDVNAILAGAGEKTELTLEYLPDEYVLETNKIVYTSGKDGFLAVGLPVAKTYLNKKNKIKIKSLADPQQALIVHVTKGNFNR
jgi:rod shape-determining protein MreC